MSDLQIYITLGVFATVILAIAVNVIDMTLAVMLGASVLIGLGDPHAARRHALAAVLRKHARAALRRHGGRAHLEADRDLRARRRAFPARDARQRQALPAAADRAGGADLRLPAQRDDRDPGRAHHHPRRAGAGSGHRRADGADRHRQQFRRPADAGRRPGDLPGRQLDRHDLHAVPVEGEPGRAAVDPGHHSAAAGGDARGVARAARAARRTCARSRWRVPGCARRRSRCWRS